MVRTFTRISALLVLALLASCAQFPWRSGGDAPPSASPNPQVFTLDLLESLEPGALLVQHDYEPGFSRFEVFYAFGRLPALSLYADGLLIYIEGGASYDQQRVMQVRLTPQQSVDMVNRMLELGYGQLESHTDFCQETGNGESTCVADAPTTILRSRLLSGELHEVKIYHNFANDLPAFKAINEYLISYQHANAQVYRPTGASLFLRPTEAFEGMLVSDWPFDASWLTTHDFGERGMVAVVLDGENLAAYLAGAASNTGDAYYLLDGQYYAAHLVPWMPGLDYHAEIEAEYPGSALPAAQ